jgi:hypothetical protein
VVVEVVLAWTHDGRRALGLTAGCEGLKGLGIMVMAWCRTELGFDRCDGLMELGIVVVA